MVLDFISVLALISGMGIFYFVLARGDLTGIILNRDAALLVFGGTLASGLMSYPFSVIKKVPGMFFYALFGSRDRMYAELNNEIIRLSKGSSEHGPSYLVANAAKIKNDFLKRGIELLLEGISAERAKEILLKESEYERMSSQNTADFFRSLAGYAPIFGLLGTLIGIVQVLRNLSDPKTMGTSMAIAITTTFYGILSANFIFSPVATKLEVFTEIEGFLNETAIDGICSIKNMENPGVVEKGLENLGQ